VSPLNDFRFSFQLYFAISRASGLGGVSARNSHGREEAVSVEAALHVRQVAQATD